MRRRHRTVARLIAAVLLPLIASVPGQASLECDGYFDAGYFGTTYYLDGYWSETVCGGGGGDQGSKKGMFGLGLGNR